jgi:hypothetical protein
MLKLGVTHEKIGRYPAPEDQPGLTIVGGPSPVALMSRRKQERARGSS